MENNEIKYFRMTLYNPLNEKDLNQDVIVVYENKGYRELLTNKKVYVIEKQMNNLDINIVLDDFFNKKCSLIGIKQNEITESFVSKYLKFTPRITIEELINNIIDIEKSLQNSIKEYQNKTFTR